MRPTAVVAKRTPYPRELAKNGAGLARPHPCHTLTGTIRPARSTVSRCSPIPRKRSFGDTGERLVDGPHGRLSAAEVDRDPQPLRDLRDGDGCDTVGLGRRDAIRGSARDRSRVDQRCQLPHRASFANAVAQPRPGARRAADALSKQHAITLEEADPKGRGVDLPRELTLLGLRSADHLRASRRRR